MVDQAEPRFPVPASPLVGREREQAVLGDALAAALAGRGSLVLIGGEAGIGKTALAEALLAEAASRGALVLVGRCYDLAETPPYGPWVEALAQAPRRDGSFAPPDFTGDGVASQAALLAAVREYLAAVAASRPLVLLLDDLHWADPASLDLLRPLARGLADAPILLLATYRADELTRRHPLYTLLPLLEREARATRLDLRRLDVAALDDLVSAGYALPVADAARLTAWLDRRAEGNAFYTTQLLRALEDEGALMQNAVGWALGDLARVGLPAPLRQVLDARVDRLGEPGRALLAVAAVIGQEVPLAVWVAVSETDEDGLLGTVERAADARLLEMPASGATVRFTHALVREALYEGTLPARRRRVHRRAGEVLAALPRPEPDAVAYHFQQADDDRATAWLIRSGERAERAYAYLTAAERFAAALHLLEATGDSAGDTPWLLLRLAWLERYAEPRRGLGYIDRAVEILAARGQIGLAGRARFALGHQLCFAGEYRRGIATMAALLDGIELAPALPAGEGRQGAWPWIMAASIDHLRASFASWSAAAGFYAQASAACERLAAHPCGGVEPHQVANAMAFVHAAHGRVDAAGQAFAARREAMQRLGDPRQAAFMILHELVSVVLPYRADRPGEWRALSAELEEAWGRSAGVMPAAWLPLARLLRALLEGRWAEAGALALPVEITHRSVVTVAASLVAPFARARGETARAWTLIRQVLPAGADTAPGDAWHLPALRLQRLAAALALDTGDLPLARRWLAAHDAWLDWSGAVLGRADGSLGWAAYHRAAGDAAAARAHAGHALALAGEPRQPLTLLAAHRALGELDSADGQSAQAADHLAEAMVLADACAAPHERALTLLPLAEMRAAVGGWAAAREALAEARAIGDRLGALPALARCDALAARLPGAPPTPGARCPVRLTAREAEVLRLLAAGMSNREMAAALCRSERTIERHLESLYRKIAARNRADAATFALRHGFA